MSIDDYARVAIDLLDHRGIDRAVFAGVSMGGYVCMAVARLAPERLSGLILVDTRETPDDEKGRQGRMDTIAKVRQAGTSPVIESMLPKMLTAAAPPELKARVRDIMASASVEGTITALEALAGRPDSTATLRALKVPALVVVGENDTITPPSDAERMAALIPQSRLVRLPNAAHLANMEQAEAFNKEVTVWMGRVK
jgi:3-oxoadipate enol-lactonase